MHFADLHAVMPDVAAGGRLPQGEVVPAVGEGLVASGKADYAGAADLIGAVLSDLPRVGGSHAQREIFDDTYILACVGAGRGSAARARLSERLSRRPSDRDRRWLESLN